MITKKPRKNEKKKKWIYVRCKIIQVKKVEYKERQEMMQWVKISKLHDINERKRKNTTKITKPQTFQDKRGN